MTYYAYLRDRVGAAALSSRVQLDQMIEAERNAFWQMLVTNPAYDERARMGALAAFDEAAGQIISESERRFAAGSAQRPGPVMPSGGDAYANGNGRGAMEAPAPVRSWRRDVLFLLIGLVFGLVLAYFGRGLIEGTLQSAGAGSQQRVPRLVASVGTFKFGGASSPTQEGEIAVEYASGAAEPTGCEVEATYRQLLEYVKFDPACRTVSFKFLPADHLIKNFNYLQGYIVFTTTITSAGSAWKGTASVYFSIDASA